MKTYTDLEQSKKLAEILPLESADCYWDYDEMQGFHRISWFEDSFNKESQLRFNENNVCAWSLTALLELMPKLYEFEDDLDDGGCQPTLCKGWDNNQWHVVYRSSIYITDWYDDPIDAAFEMICWLKENGEI